MTCPAQRTAPIVYNADPGHRHHGQASFGEACAACPLCGQCTRAAGGRTVTITAYEAELAALPVSARPTPTGPPTTARPGPKSSASWPSGPPSPRRSPRAVRGLAKVAADFSLLAAAVNLARLGVLGLRWTPADGWAAA